MLSLATQFKNFIFKLLRALLFAFSKALLLFLILRKAGRFLSDYDQQVLRFYPFQMGEKGGGRGWERENDLILNTRKFPS